MGKKIKWTDEEIKLLINFFNNGESFNDIENKLPNRTLSAIKSKAFEIGLNSNSNKEWSNNEIDLLTRLYLTNFNISNKELIKNIPTQTIDSIKLKIKELHLKKNKERISANSIIGQRFGRLSVLSVVGIRDGFKIVHCKCDCGKEKDVKLNKLLSGELVSCGCYRKDNASKLKFINKKENIYDITSFTYGIGKTDNGIIFYFDKEDYELIKKYSWHTHNANYIRTCYDTIIDENGNRHNKYIMMHQLISKKYFNGKLLDHINGRPNDNRKCNLRIITQMNNAKNLKLSKANTSGHKGVFRENGAWKAFIQSDKIKYDLGTYNNYDEAVEAREKAEKELFKEYSRKKEFLNG